MPSFGIFKKLKEAFKKAKGWLSKALPQARIALEQARPLVQTIINDATPQLPQRWQPTMKKVSQLYDVTQKGIEAADDAINHNHDDVSAVKDWTNANLTPRLKAGFR